MTELPERSTSGRRQLAAFAVVCACIVGARVYLAVVHSIDSRAGWRLPESSAPLAALIALAVLLSTGSAWLGMKFFNKPSAILIAMAVGGLTTTGYNGFLGAVPGVMAGMLVASSIARRTVLAFAVGVAAVAYGIVGGALALWFDPDLSDGPSIAAVMVGVIALAAAVTWIYRPRPSPPTFSRRWNRRLGKIAVVVSIIGGFWGSLSVDMVRRVRNLVPLSASFVPFAGWYDDGWIEIRPPSVEWFWLGPLRPKFVSFVVREEATDDDLRRLRGFTRLQDLTILGNHITDAGLRHLSGLASLTSLTLESSRITDDGCRSLRRLGALESLELNQSHVTLQRLTRLPARSTLVNLSLNNVPMTDSDLSVLKSFPRLLRLSLSGTKISDEGVHHICSLRWLTALDVSRTNVGREGAQLLSTRAFGSLNVSGTAITDEDLNVFMGFSELRMLKLASTRVTDAGVPDLAKIPGLVALDLSKTRITDASIPDIEAIASLCSLDLYRTKVTKAGIDRLRESMPNCLLGHND